MDVVVRGKTGSLLPGWPWMLLIVGLCLAQAYVAKPWTPIHDETQYLAYGRVLALIGRYASTTAGPAADAMPGREPLYPLVVALAMRLDPGLAARSEGCSESTADVSCPSIYRALWTANALFVALTAIIVYATTRLLGGGGGAAAIASAYVVVNFQIMRDVRHCISDYLAVMLTAALGLALAAAVRQPRAAARWLAAGLLLGLLILTKGAFLVFGALCAAGSLTMLLVRRDRPSLLALLAALLALGMAFGWIIRNDLVFGRPTFTDDRGAIALSTREALDHMTLPEYGTSWLWWTRGFGPGLAKKRLPERDWRRFEWEAADGFYQQGQVSAYEARLSRLMAERGLTRIEAQAQVNRVILDEIVTAWPRYLVTLPPVFYRGLWFDEFVVVGFPAFVWLLLRAWHRREAVWPLVAAPSLFALLFYPAASLNLPRYQMVDVAAFAVAAGLILDPLSNRLRRTATWRQRGSSP